MAAAATEARLSGRVLRRREPLGVSGRGRRPSRRPGRTRPKLGPGEGPRGGQGSGHFWVQPALALHPRPRGLRTSEGEKGPCQLLVLSRDSQARAGEGLWACDSSAPEKGALSPSVFRRFPTSSPQKTPPTGWEVPVTTPWGES